MVDFAKLRDRKPTFVDWRVPDWRSLPMVALTGCALGVDQDAAGVWYRMGVPYVAVVPFDGQDSRWPAEARRVYAQVLEKAAGVKVVGDQGEDPRAALFRRNEWMCCADHLISVWDGSHGGTAHATRLWQRAFAPVSRINPDELRRRVVHWHDDGADGNCSPCGDPGCGR